MSLKLTNSINEVNPELITACLKLFRAVPTKNQTKKNPSKAMTEFTVGHGFIFAPQVVANFGDKELRIMADVINEELTITPQQMNQTFNKSWKKVRDAPYSQLLAEQCFHYMTTYGYKQMGVFDHDTVYIPNERLDIPEIDGGVKLVLINGYTKTQLKKKFMVIVNSGMAFKSIEDLVTIAKYVGMTDKEVIALKNKEVRTNLYSHLDLIPEDPTELLRLAVFETTEKTLLISNKDSTKAIKSSDKGSDMVKLFEQYDEHFGYSRLAEIYNRFSRLFLAFKQVDDDMRPIINKIGHLSKTYHKPMKYSFLNNITGMLSRGDTIKPAQLKKELGDVNIFRKIRLAQSLRYRVKGNKSIVYKVRNGKSFATTMNFTNIEGATNVYNTIIDSIVGDLKHLKGKEFYIPDNIVYSVPATEKQMSGMIPTGSYVKVGKDMIFGIWWTNVDGQTDLDLHGDSRTGGHIGWHTGQRTGNRNLMRTGDITDAPDGAVELFYMNKDYMDEVLYTLNYYNYRDNTPVPYKLMIAEEHPNAFGSDYTIDPKNMKCIINSVIDVPQQTIGLGTVEDGECRFYFSESTSGTGNVVRGGKNEEIARDYFANFFKDQITFNQLLVEVGAKVVTELTKKSIDLSPEGLQKDTFIKLLIKQ